MLIFETDALIHRQKQKDPDKWILFWAYWSTGRLLVHRTPSTCYNIPTICTQNRISWLIPRTSWPATATAAICVRLLKEGYFIRSNLAPISCIALLKGSLISMCASSPVCCRSLSCLLTLMSHRSEDWWVIWVSSCRNLPPFDDTHVCMSYQLLCTHLLSQFLSIDFCCRFQYFLVMRIPKGNSTD